MNKFDKSNMRQVILDFPKQFGVGIKAAQHITLNPSARGGSASGGKSYQLNAIVIAGVGGSALPAELLKLFGARLNFWRAKTALHIHRNYGLPAYADKNTLVVCISYSGNTEEALSAYAEACKRKVPVVCIASGGKLVEWAKKDGVPCAVIPGGIQPRAAVGYQYAALCKILSRAGLIASQDTGLKQLVKTLRSASLKSKGKALAKKIVGRTPVVYASQNNKALALIWKIKFNENAKTLAFWNYFPELNHNEMVAFGQQPTTNNQQPTRRFFPIILRDKDDHPRIQKRMKLTAQLIKERGYPVEILDIKGNTIYNRVFTTLLLGDWTSYHLALLYKTDPTPVDIVETFKALMGK